MPKYDGIRYGNAMAAHTMHPDGPEPQLRDYELEEKPESFAQDATDWAIDNTVGRIPVIGNVYHGVRAIYDLANGNNGGALKHGISAITGLPEPVSMGLDMVDFAQHSVQRSIWEGNHPEATPPPPEQPTPNYQPSDGPTQIPFEGPAPVYVNPEQTTCDPTTQSCAE